VTEPFPEQFREMLQRLRHKSGLTRRELGELTGPGGVAEWTIRDLERGETLRPRRETLHKLADALMLADAERAAFIAAGLAAAAPERTSTKGDHNDVELDQEHQTDLPLVSASPPRTLPYDIGSSFTGRTAELERLANGAQWAALHGRTAVYVIEGMGGTGKTVLAVHAAHLIIGESPCLFPDAQLFLNLRGYTHDLSALTANKASNALTANEALRSLLHQLGVPDRHIPTKSTDRESLFRSTLAGKRALIILDNAKDAAQVRPLLPGSSTCLVIVTTRDSLRGLDGTTVLPLDTPTETEAIELFTRASALGHAAPAPAPSRADLAKIVALCGYLPLAIQIAAARLRHRDAYTVADILAELQAEDDRLSRLQDRDRGVRAAVQSSLRYLDAAEKDLFTRLALIPGMDFGAYAATSLPAGRTGDQVGQIRERLDSLLDRHLLVQRSPGRYEFHDLVRRYAQQRAARELSEPARAQAIDRLLDFYLHTAQVADRLFESGLPRADDAEKVPAPPAAIPELRTPQEAKAWLFTELRSLRAATELATASGRHRVAIWLPAALSDYLRTHGPWSWALALHESALDVARSTFNRPGQAGALRSMGGVLSRIGEIAESKKKLSAALVIYRELGNQRGIGRTLIELGIAQRVDDKNADSLSSLTEALKVFDKLGNTLGEAAARTELASVFYETKSIPQAERHVAAGLRLYRNLGNRQGQAAALLYRGPILQVMGALDAAEESLREAGDIGRQLGQPILVANSLVYLSDVQREAKHLTEALQSVNEAQKLYQQLNYRQGIGLTLSYLGRILTLMDPAEADARIAEAVALFDAIGDLSDKAEALITRAALACDIDRKAALCYYQEALECAREAHSPRGQAAAHLGLAALSAHSDRAGAITHCREALALYHTAGDDTGIARARDLLGTLVAN
jgi:tetratricopeptide (TPR) repeat protein/transcriptional regulator with XRE-family HTH domain